MHIELSDLTNRGPFVIANEIFYQITQDPTTQLDQNCLSLGQHSLALQPAGDVATFEHFQRTCDPQHLEAHKKEYCEQNIDQSFLQDYIPHNRSYYDILKFAILEVMPLMLVDKRALGQLLTGNESKKLAPLQRIERKLYHGTKKQAHTELVEEFLKQKHEKINIEPIYNIGTDKTAHTILGKLTGNEPVLVDNQQVYSLHPIPDKNSGWSVTLHGKTYEPKQLCSKSLLENRYSDAQKNTIELEAFNEFQKTVVDSLQSKQRMYQAFNRIIEDRRFCIDDIGITLDTDNYFAYLYKTIPKFAMKYPLKDDMYIAFNACDVAIQLREPYDHNEPRGPYVINSNMFSPMIDYNNNVSRESPLLICVRDDVKQRIQRKYKPKNVIDQLAQGITTLQHGLTKETMCIHRQHGDYMFSHWYIDTYLKENPILTLQQAKQQGYQITNIHGD